MVGKGKLLRNVLIMNMDSQLEDISNTRYGKSVAELTAEQLYVVVVMMIRGLVDTFDRTMGEKKFYYISTAFDNGKFLENNLTNLGIYEILEGVLVSKGQEIETLKKVEQEYIGKAGTFKDTSRNFFLESKRRGLQTEAMAIRCIIDYEDRKKEINNPIEEAWLEKCETKHQVMFNGKQAGITFYDMNLLHIDKEIYKFHLYDIEIEDEIDEQDKQIYYDYFFVNASVKQILQEMKEKKYDLREMDNYVAIGMEGKYVAFIIPELVRVMVDGKGIPMEEAIEVVRKTCGYSDFQVMADAVSVCPLEYTEKLVSQFVEKIKEVERKRMEREQG